MNKGHISELWITGNVEEVILGLIGYRGEVGSEISDVR